MTERVEKKWTFPRSWRMTAETQFRVYTQGVAARLDSPSLIPQHMNKTGVWPLGPPAGSPAHLLALSFAQNTTVSSNHRAASWSHVLFKHNHLPFSLNTFSASFGKFVCSFSLHHSPLFCLRESYQFPLPHPCTPSRKWVISGSTGHFSHPWWHLSGCLELQL